MTPKTDKALRLAIYWLVVLPMSLPICALVGMGIGAYEMWIFMFDCRNGFNWDLFSKDYWKKKRAEEKLREEDEDLLKGSGSLRGRDAIVSRKPGDHAEPALSPNVNGGEEGVPLNH